MRFYEGCKVIDPYKSFSCIAEYTNSIFEIAHSTTVFVALEPASIATKIDGILRRIVIAPGYAILCNSMESYDIDTAYDLAETVWIESGVLIPYSASEPCSNRIRKYRIPLEIHEQLGIPYICTKNIDEEYLHEFAHTGGVLELSNDKYCGVGTLKLIPIKDKFFLISKGLGVRSVYPGIRYTLIKVDVPLKLGVQGVKLSVVDGNPVLISIGRSYLIAFESLEPVEDYIYLPLLIAVHSLPSREPKAKYYMYRLSSWINSTN
ncbi:MAG: hypothetical protein N3D82_04925 [Ignisphaera sp.]|nr:hypothetical protein [Ignisphaera sp.]MCX8168351.1 hypothetical protein [Ignisphaera sp.]MDW8085316.1 hypothetical protein [Ignisphaera sp.]